MRRRLRRWWLCGIRKRHHFGPEERHGRQCVRQMCQRCGKIRLRYRIDPALRYVEYLAYGTEADDSDH